MYIGVSVCGGGGPLYLGLILRVYCTRFSSPSQPVKYVCTTGLI